MTRAFWKRLGRMGQIPWYILTRCLCLSAVSLLGALVLALAAGPCTTATYSVHTWAGALRDGGLMLFGTGLVGSVLMEDILGSR